MFGETRLLIYCVHQNFEAPACFVFCMYAIAVVFTRVGELYYEYSYGIPEREEGRDGGGGMVLT